MTSFRRIVAWATLILGVAAFPAALVWAPQEPAFVVFLVAMGLVSSGVNNVQTAEDRNRDEPSKQAPVKKRPAKK